MSCNINELANGKNAKFEVNATDLLSFCDCLSLIRNKIGLIAWGEEDFYTLFEEGTTFFYTMKDKSITSAIESLKLKINQTEVLDYAFFIVVCSEKQLDLAYNAFESMSQYIPNCNLWFQIFPLRETNEDITLYLLTNKR